MRAIRPMRLSLTLLTVGFAFVCCSAAARADMTVFGPTGAEQTFTVPVGVISIHAVAVGGKGGSANSASGGFGAQATADLSVTPGEVLYVEVGGNGGNGAGCNGGGTAGFNGGGAGGSESLCMSGGDGGGGGGASDVRTVRNTLSGSLSSRMIVAGGGAGGAYDGTSDGSGGAAGQVGGGPHAGQPGTSTAGGSGGGGNAADGALGNGGAGGNDTTQAAGGGGGGGGVYGGGGGRNGSQGSYFGSGGGGGSSGFASGATNTSVVPDTTGAPSITFTYTATAFHSLTIAKTSNGTGTVTSTDGQIHCGSTCAYPYQSGTVVTLTATPAAGSMFAGWAGGGCSGTGACAVTMSADQAVTATFTAKPSPPNTSIGKATINSSKGTATFTFSSSGRSTGFQCALVRKGQQAKFKSCKSPQFYRHLKPGKYTFAVRAVGPGGADPSPAIKQFKIT